MRNQLTQERLKELLHYDPETGYFTWKISPNNAVKVGSVAGTSMNNYIRIIIDHKAYLAHRLAFLYMEGYFPEHEVDHINRIRDDNRWKNLRHVSRQCNNRNCIIGKNNKSGVIGVSWSKPNKKWVSQITVERKVNYLGRFVNLKDAVQARWEAEVKYGFPNCNTTSSAFTYLEALKCGVNL